MPARCNVKAFRGSRPRLDAKRGLAALLLFAALSSATAVGQWTPQPVFTELFAYDPAAPSQLLGNWRISSQLDRKLQPLRVGVVEELQRQDGRPRHSAGGRRARRRERGDATGQALCLRQGGLARGGNGGRARRRRTQRAGGDPGEIRPRDRRRRAGEIRAARVVPLLLQDRRRLAAGRSGGGTSALPHRHPPDQQDSFKEGKSCSASPFFKIEARPLGQRVRFFAQVAAGAPCAQPPMVMRAQICRRDLPRDGWTTVQVHLNPAHDANGGVDIWLDGIFCGAYQGPMADRDYGARRNGAPFINAQPRFGISRLARGDPDDLFRTRSCSGTRTRRDTRTGA